MQAKLLLYERLKLYILYKFEICGRKLLVFMYAYIYLFLYFRCTNYNYNIVGDSLKPSAQNRFLSLRHAIFVFPVAAQSRRLSLLETISEALLRETILWGCVGVIFQANSLLFFWLSKSSGPRFLSRDTRFFFI